MNGGLSVLVQAGGCLRGILPIQICWREQPVRRRAVRVASGHHFDEAAILEFSQVVVDLVWSALEVSGERPSAGPAQPRLVGRIGRHGEQTCPTGPALMAAGATDSLVQPPAHQVVPRAAEVPPASCALEALPIASAVASSPRSRRAERPRRALLEASASLAKYAARAWPARRWRSFGDKTRPGSTSSSNRWRNLDRAFAVNSRESRVAWREWAASFALRVRSVGDNKMRDQVVDRASLCREAASRAWPRDSAMELFDSDLR